MIAEKMELKNWTSEVLLRRMGYDLLANKFVITIKSGEKAKKLMVKVSSSCSLKDLIQREANSIDSIVKAGVQGIPETILHGSFDDRYFIAQEFVEGKKPHSSSGTFDAAYQISSPWLSSLLSKTSTKEVDAERLLKKAQNFSKISSEFFPTIDAMFLMEKIAPSTGIPTSWVHGDFWHGNLLIDPNGKLWVTDFAFSAPDEPAIDVLDIISDYEPSIFISQERLMRYTRAFIPKDINPLFLVLYMLNRKMALKVNEKKRLYDELLVLDLSKELANIGEAAILQDLGRAMRSNSPDSN